MKIYHRLDSFYKHTSKRQLDLLAGSLILILISPLLLLIYIYLWIAIGKPVIFKQVRPGYLGELFTIYKFRTMTEDRDEYGSLLPDERRMTVAGTFVRNLSFDELPEIFNVLKGDMSIVGPRPLLVEYLDRYSPEQARRHDVRPGITGWAQVNGRNAISWEEKFALDVWYVDHQSLQLDLKVLAMTVVKVLRREGISEEGYATASDFMGNGKDTGQRDL